MVFIFADVIAKLKDRLNYLLKQFRNAKVSVKITTYCVISAVCILIGMGAAGTRFGYKVRYGDEVIAAVGSKRQLTAAVSMVADLVKGDSSEDAVKPLRVNPALVLKSEMEDETKLAETIIRQNKKIISAAALSVDGKTVAILKEEPLTALLSERLSQYEKDGTGSSSRFLQKVSVDKGYYFVSDLDAAETVRDVVNGLTVQTVLTEVTDTPIPFQTVQQKDSTHEVGYTAVVRAGQNGVSRTTAQVTLLNGAETARVDGGTQIVAEPVDEIVVIGTAKSTASAAEKQAAYSSGFIFPIPKTKYRIGAYFGDGRNHKGVDICTDAGTPIYAVADGTVVFSGWDGSYGNCVVIDHGNGLQTRYAHNSVNTVEVGQTVSAGDVIGKVGKTGNATGFHVHFEIIKGKTKVNPAPYIGLS